MMDRLAQLMDGGRGIAVGSIVVAAAIGMAVTVARAGALGDEGPEVQPIVIDTSTGGQNADGAGASDDVDDDGDAGRVGAVDGDDADPPATSWPSGREPSDGGTGTGSGPSAGSGSSTGSDTASDAISTGPVSTAPPPPPVTAASPVGGGGGDEPDETDSDPDSDESDGGEGGEDD